MTNPFNGPLAPHWTTDEGRDMANVYAIKTRDQIAMSTVSDFALANAVYLAGRTDPELLPLQTAAKERIRWLSVQLALANAQIDQMMKEGYP